MANLIYDLFNKLFRKIKHLFYSFYKSGLGKMNSWLIYSLGFIAQLLFSGRMILQWFLSEKSKKIITPIVFWHLSLLASFLLFLYGYLRDDFAIMMGQTLTYFIYIRNLQLQGEWYRIPRFFRIFLWIFPLLIVFYGFNNNQYDAAKLFRNDAIPFWMIILGSLGQIIFYSKIYLSMGIFRKKKSIQSSSWILVTQLIGFWNYHHLCDI